MHALASADVGSARGCPVPFVELLARTREALASFQTMPCGSSTRSPATCHTGSEHRNIETNDKPACEIARGAGLFLALPPASQAVPVRLGRHFDLERFAVTEPFLYRRRVEFRDTDAAGIMHFSTFFLRMEEAEHALLRSLGTTVWRVEDEGKVSWPRVSAQCDYRGPVRFEDWLDVEVRVARLGETSVTYDFRFLLDGKRVADGQVTAVCCLFTVGKPPRPIAIPADLRQQLERYLLPPTSESSA